jgi:hypothetical protein
LDVRPTQIQTSLAFFKFFTDIFKLAWKAYVEKYYSDAPDMFLIQDPDASALTSRRNGKGH